MDYTPKLDGWRPESSSPVVSPTDQNLSVNMDKLVTGPSENISVENNGVVDLRPWCSPVENQGHVGSCVANSVVGALEFLNIRDGKPHVDLSRLYIYYNARLMTRTQDKDEGTYISVAMKTLASLGTCPESTWKYDPSSVFSRPSWEAYREGYANKIHSFYRIDGTGSSRNDGIVAALRAKHPVAFGMLVDSDYMALGPSGLTGMPSPHRKVLGGHAQLIVGADLNMKLFVVRNSWGPGWALAGHALIPWDYLDASEADDFWTPTAVL